MTKPNSQSAFSLIEITIAIGLMGLIAVGVTQVFDNSMTMIRTSQRMMVATELGEWAYTLMKDRSALAATAIRPSNARFLDCYQNKICPTATDAAGRTIATPFQLYQRSRPKAFAGTAANPALYTESGRRCVEDSPSPACNVRLEAFFTGGNYLQSATPANADYVIIRVDLTFAGNNRPMTSYTHMVELNPYLYSADQLCNPGSSDNSKKIVNGFNLGALKCGI